MSQYLVGTCKLITNSAQILGYDTLWNTNNNVQAGDLFKRAGSSYPSWYQIDVIDGNATFHLTTAYQGASADNVDYVISRDFTPLYDLVELAYGDKDWPTIFTRNMRAIDAYLAGYAPPYSSITWKQPVNVTADLPSEDNQDGDARVILSSMHVKLWNNSNSTWDELPLADHAHGDLYYTETEIDAKFNVSTGHDHDGSDSKKVDYTNLLNTPATFAPANHNLTASSHPVSGLTNGHFLKATGASSFAFQAHGLTAGNVGAAITEHTHAQLHTQNTDTETNSDDFAVGDGATGTHKTITAKDGRAESRKLRYNETSQKWEFSNDGVTYAEMSATTSVGDADTVDNKHANNFPWNSPTYDDTQIIQPVVAGVIASQLKAKAGDTADIQRIFDNAGATAATWTKDGNLELKTGKTLDGVDLSVHYNATGSEHAINTLIAEQKIEHDSADVGTATAHGKLLTLDTGGKFPSGAIPSTDVSDRSNSLEYNTIIQNLRDMALHSASYRNIINGFVDDFYDSLGIDAEKSSNYSVGSSYVQASTQYLTNYETGGDSDSGIGTNLTTDFPRRGQSFQFASPATAVLGGIVVYLKYYSGTTQNLTVEIRNDNAGVPGSTVYSTGTISAFSTPTYAWIYCNLSPQVSLSASTTYWLVVKLSNEAGDAVYHWYRDQTTPTYAEGVGAYYDTAWTAQSTVDFYFRITKQVVIQTKVLKARTAPDNISVLINDRYRSSGLDLITVLGSRNGGANWVTFPNATWGCTYDSTKTCFTYNSDITACPSGTEIVLKTLISQSIYEMHGFGAIWY